MYSILSKLDFGVLKLKFLNFEKAFFPCQSQLTNFLKNYCIPYVCKEQFLEINSQKQHKVKDYLRALKLLQLKPQGFKLESCLAFLFNGVLDTTGMFFSHSIARQNAVSKTSRPHQKMYFLQTRRFSFEKSFLYPVRY